MQNLQKNMGDMQEKLSQIEVSGSAGGDMVEVTLSGSLDVLKVSISPETFNREEVHVLEDLIKAAFTDASKKAYGFVVYAAQNGIVNFVFAKAKVTPLRSKTLPQLELLAVFAAVKYLFNLLLVFEHVRVRRVYVVCDAQVILSWCLSSVVKTKNIFTANRIKDVKKMVTEIKDLG